MWEETLVFTVHMPEIALVRFLVWDHDPIGRDFIGQRTLAFSSMMPGAQGPVRVGEGRAWGQCPYCAFPEGQEGASWLLPRLGLGTPRALRRRVQGHSTVWLDGGGGG